MSQSSLPIEEHLCFAIYVATHAYTRVYRPLLANLGLTYPQYLVILVLLQRGSQNVTALAAELTLDAAALTPLLKRLEAAGFVNRDRSTEDERIVNITLTAKGRALEGELAEITQQVGRLTGLSTDQRASMRKSLFKLARTLSVAEPVVMGR